MAAITGLLDLWRPMHTLECRRRRHGGGRGGGGGRSRSRRYNRDRVSATIIGAEEAAGFRRAAHRGLSIDAKGSMSSPTRAVAVYRIPYIVWGMWQQPTAADGPHSDARRVEKQADAG
ncbi:hypothetical protein V491_03840 [Pseudogymnoascus sp. VKM F-3775]|nr:hypothetical protein V491_03840 [Pseudogymnoascus sp. VKM F-3775]